MQRKSQLVRGCCVKIKLIVPWQQGCSQAWTGAAFCASCPMTLDVPVSHLHRALHQDNVSVNLFVVNKPWLFSLLWCAGVDSVTTNDCQLLQQMRYPVWIIVRALGLSPPLLPPLSLLLLNPGLLFLT